MKMRAAREARNPRTGEAGGFSYAIQNSALQSSQGRCKINLSKKRCLSATGFFIFPQLINHRL